MVLASSNNSLLILKKESFMKSSSIIRYVSSVALCMLLSACGSSPEYSPYGGTKNPAGVKLGKPYVIKGQRYVPEYDPDYRERGKASWYGPGFNGRMTASGEQFDEDEITAAHRTLPMPSMVRVTRVDNGRSVVVRVNDRGPFSHARIIDLSKASARAIGLDIDGVAHVDLEYLPEETERYYADMGLTMPAEWKRTTPAPVYVASADAQPAKANIGLVSDAYAAPVAPNTNKGVYRVQVATLSNSGAAEKLANRLSTIAAPVVTPLELHGRTLYRVALGPVRELNAAQQIHKSLHEEGFYDAKIITNE